jgi:hypothetical protein
MDRTYNIFVDNGLFVLANYLDKEVKDINLEDIKDSTNYFSELFSKAYKTEKYSKLAFSSFQNSSYTQKPTSVVEQYNTILNNLGNDSECPVCGCKTVNDNIEEDFRKALTKGNFPRLSTNTFYNFSNNLKGITICPICVYLGMLSFFNIKAVGKQCVLYNSDDDEFMYDYTHEHEIEFNRDIMANEKQNKDKYLETIEKNIINLINKNKIYDGYINMSLFYNSSQGESFNNDILTKKDLRFLKELQSKSMSSEFIQQGLFYQLLKDNLQKKYLSYVFDFKEDKLKVSKELFNIIEERYNKLRKDKLELIKRVSKQVCDNISKDIVKDLKGIDKLNQFEKMLMNWIEEIPNLMTTDEFDNLCNIKEFSSVKNRIYVELINLKNEGER